MLEFLRQLLDWAKRRFPAPWVETAATTASLYVAALVAAYEYAHWRYGVTPTPDQFLRSYLFKSTTAAFACAALSLLLVRPRVRGESGQRPGGLARAWIWTRQVGLRRAAGLALVLCITGALVLRWLPARAQPIRVAFLGKLDFDQDAFAYTLYELNRLQDDWHLELDFRPLDEEALSTSERASCSDALCVVEKLSAGQATIAVTSRPLGDGGAFFANRANISVVSTEAWASLAPPTVYEYLAHAVAVQTVLIHLNQSCQGMPRGSLEPGWTSRGSIFEATPHRRAMKAAVMAAHLGREDDALLTQCFGVDYAARAARLLSLDWLLSERVRSNLERGFSIRL